MSVWKLLSLLVYGLLLNACNYHDITIIKPETTTTSTTSGKSANGVKKDTTGTEGDTTKINPVPNILGDNPNIYLAGFVNQSAVIWKNGAADTLSKNAFTQSVFIEGNDVYVAGWI